MVTMHGYHLALIKVSPPHTHTHNPRKNDYISIIVPVSCTLLVYKIHNVKSREQTFLLSKEGLLQNVFRNFF